MAESCVQNANSLDKMSELTMLMIIADQLKTIVLAGNL